MTADEKQICVFLKSWHGQFVSAREISRRAAGKRRLEREPDWAVTPLARLVEKGIIESDSTGHYRLRPRDDQTKRRWVSPQIKKLLEESGKNFDGAIQVNDGEDDF